MKIAVILSGSIRAPRNSLDSIAMFADHDVTTFIHAWRNVEKIKDESFSKRPNVEPSDKLLTSYPNAHVRTDDWMVEREKFIADLEKWKTLPHVPEHTNNISMHGMYFSLKRASEYVLDWIMDYELIVRLRFDCKLLESIKNYAYFGWTIPEGNDFYGLNDQFGFFRPYPGDAERSRREASAYLECYDAIGPLIESGTLHGPECVLKANFDRLGVMAWRQQFGYTIYGD